MNTKSTKTIGALLLCALIYFPGQAQSSLLNSAKKNFEAGQLRQAKIEIDTVVTHKKTIDDPESWYYRGQIYTALFMSEEDRYTDINYDAGKEAYLAYAKVQELDGPNDKGETGSFYQKAIDQQKELALPLLRRGKFFYEKENYLKAMEYLELVQELHPNNQEAYLVAAQAAIDDKHGGRAKQYYDKLEKLGYESAEMYANKIKIAYLFDVNYPQATRLVKEATTKYPNNKQIMDIEYRFYISDRKYEKAITTLEKLIKMDPKNAQYYYDMGEIHNHRRSAVLDTAKANTYFLKAVAAKSDHYEALMDLGNNYYEIGQERDKSIPELKVDKTIIKKSEVAVTEDSIVTQVDTIILTEEQIEFKLDSLQKIRYIKDSLARKAYKLASIYLQRAYDINSNYALLRRNLAIVNKRLKKPTLTAFREEEK